MVKLHFVTKVTAAGILIALAGEACCFVIDAVSYVAVVAALLAVWTTWFLVARIPLYETSAAARIEAGVSKSGSPISRCTMVRPLASSARALASTSKAVSVPS